MSLFIDLAIAFSLIIFMAWYLIFAPYWLREKIETSLLFIQAAILWFIDFTLNAVNFATHILHWLGRVFIIIIFIGAGLTLTDNIANIFDFGFIQEKSYLFKLTRLLEDKITWVASTAIVATTVALGHIKTLDFNYEKHREETLEKIRAKRNQSNKNT